MKGAYENTSRRRLAMLQLVRGALREKKDSGSARKEKQLNTRNVPLPESP
jgi:hypothetical protein